jgi:RNA polymerase sigma-70 factor (ECF subfamily)
MREATRTSPWASGEAQIGEAGREERFAELVRTHRDRALRLAWRLMGGDAAAAEEVVQEAFVRAWRGLDRFRGDSSLGTWFYRIVVRQAHNQRRWRALRELWDGPLPAEPPDSRAQAAGDPLLRRRIVAALETLTARQRDAFVLVHLEGFTAREAAELLATAEGTVKSHLHRALVALRRELGDLREPLRGECT